MRKTKNEKKQNNGITLISLVITIIVMLILVGVSINLAVNGGLFEYAGNAVGDTKNAIAEENEIGNGGIKVDGKDYSIIEIIEGTVPNPKEKFSEIYTENKKITEEVDSKTYTAWIPKGFAVGISKGINTIAGGLVITDKVNSQGQSIGNEFVWIPVEVVKEGDNKDSETSIASFYRSAWEENTRTNTLTSTSFPTSNKTWSSYEEPLTSGGYAGEEAEYYDMLKSVYTYEGFYIGRYEAGTDAARTDTSNGTSKMVVQRDKYPYNYVGWGQTMSDYTSNVTYSGKDQGLGALALSKAMYANKDVGVTSTLCYGVMWDAMLDFIIKDSSYSVTNSTTWGNHDNNTGDDWKITRTTAKWTTSPNSDTDWTPVGKDGKTKTSSSSEILLTTGANDNFSAKNIYDVAGNVYEWTNEAFSARIRVLRGGGYRGDGVRGPASYRTWNIIVNGSSSYGFRPALYITNND